MTTTYDSKPPKAWLQGYRAGHRNRRLGMGRPRIAGTVLYATPDQTFCDREYGIGYFKGWLDSNHAVLNGDESMLPCAAGRMVGR